ncbi:hypothetical protein HanIR_Chr11g0513451 [Helianthus annuus]|nr:hypothetical protein HanIR_Chr11g0513451 [Helianthus annuus]
MTSLAILFSSHSDVSAIGWGVTAGPTSNMWKYRGVTNREFFFIAFQTNLKNYCKSNINVDFFKAFVDYKKIIRLFFSSSTSPLSDRCYRVEQCKIHINRTLNKLKRRFCVLKL